MKRGEKRREFLHQLGLLSLAAGIGTAFPTTSFGQKMEKSWAKNNENTRLKIYNGKIITPYRTIPQGTIVVIGGEIVEISKGNIEVPDALEIDAKGQNVSPGFIDLHVHGGGGYSFLDGSTEAFLKIAQIHAQHGTTSLYPTALSGDLEELYKNLEIYELADKMNKFGAQFLGVFLEGPYYSMAERGAQNPKYIRDPNPQEYNEVLSRTSAIKRWDCAPERKGALDFIRYLHSKGVQPSIGHTSATYDEILPAFEYGCNIMTHLYSGMAGVTRRDSFRFAGGVQSAYLIDEMNVEVIADGRHLPASLLKLIYERKGADRIALVTDSMRAAGMPDGTESILGSLDKGLKVIIEDGVAKLPDRSSFAGSVATTDRLVRTMISLADVPLIDAVRMMTITPANIMGIADRKGSLVPGKDADILIFNDNIDINTTIIQGNVIYNKNQ